MTISSPPGVFVRTGLFIVILSLVGRTPRLDLSNVDRVSFENEYDPIVSDSEPVQAQRSLKPLHIVGLRTRIFHIGVNLEDYSFGITAVPGQRFESTWVILYGLHVRIIAICYLAV